MTPQESVQPLRIGAVSFLNTVPLIEGLAQDPDVELQRDLPSRLADLLFEGRVDVALIPTVEYLRGVGTELVPDICIAANGPVRTVRVFSQIPLEDAEDIAVDRGSRSSVALLRVLLAERFDRHPDLHIVEPRPEALFHHHPTVLVIGDRSDEVDTTGLHVYDLGEMWKEHTGLPFVFAAWVLGPQMAPVGFDTRRREVVEKLRGARAAGAERMEALAREEATRRGMAVSSILDYWNNCIHFDLGQREMDGLQKFADLAAKHNLVPGPRALSVADV